MKKIQKILITLLIAGVLVPVFASAQGKQVFTNTPATTATQGSKTTNTSSFPTGSGYNTFNGTAIQDPSKKNTGTFPTGSGYVKPTTGGLGQKTLQQLVTDFIVVSTMYILRILLALIILMFMYGLMKYMFKGQESDAARTEGRKLMLWGIIGIFAVTSVWGLVAFFTGFIGHGLIVIPQFKSI